jgi:hypothetical protein
MLAFRFIILFLVVSAISIAQPKTSNADTLSLKKKIKQEGNIIKALEWKEKTEKHFLVLYESLKDTNDARTAKLFAYHFIEKGNDLEQQWKVYDFEKECPLDILASFSKESVQLTDLNKNGIPEIWMIYKTYCKGDVSPSTMKLIMYEGKQKYAMRGTSKVRVSEKEFMGGEYKFDKAFEASTSTIKKYAQQLWKKFVVETP